MDRIPLLIGIAEQAFMANKLIFSHELGWMKQEGFSEVVSIEWANISGGV
jgi:hypothetical protein